MNQVENAVIKYAIDFERYKNGQANEIIKLLDKANNEIAGYIKKTNGIATKARYKDITRKLKEISERLKESVGENIDIDGVINYELQKQKKLFGFARPFFKKKKTGKIDFVYPTIEQIKTAALFQPIIDEGYGLTFQSFLEGIQTGLFNTWDSALRTGYLTGIPTKQIVTNVLGKSSKVGELVTPGTMKTLKNSVYSNTRTALQSFANETMQRVYKENDRLFGDIYPKDGEVYKYEYLATLDNRTCLVCADSAKLYKELEDIPHIPQHRGCRCVVIPYFNIEGDTRSSKDGQVRADITFDEWLRGQDEKTQLDVLGRSRFELFRRGEPISQFVDNGKVLDLTDLNANILAEKEIDIQTYLSKNVSEPDITRLTDHVKQRITERDVSLDDIYDTLANPLYVGDVRKKDGAYQVIGLKATVGVSAFDGTIATCWKTGRRTLKRIKEGKLK